MNSKTLIWGGMFVGGSVGGFLPYLWGGGMMAYTLWSAIGGLAGIWLGFNFAKATGVL